MKPTKTVHIALGSNKGNKLQYLQSAVDAIFNRIGVVQKISKVYKTPAVGFEGDDFFNACIAVETELKPKKILKELQAIEKELGRKTKMTKSYESREIDLDILFFEDEIIEEKFLVIPHPKLHNRKFVLQPLVDIAKDFKHPILNKSIETLLSECRDESVIEHVNIWLKNPRKNFTFNNYSYIAIEGNIGAGKTSLTNKIARDFNAKLILERFADNAFLPKFYKEPERYAFTLEMSFLADRYQQISDDLSQLDLFKDFVVSDYDVYKSLIFSKITLPEDEFRLYRKLFYQVYKDIAKPDLYIYLYQNTERLQANIKKRGRNYEKDIKDDYLEKINTGYLEFLKNQQDMNVKIIDISEKDFVKSREDYLWLLGEINQSAVGDLQ
ncbi:2-amino-4-hydroxy-6-hydroxymethyldihydropteridine diphosphokinase [Winogradskyella bathintestinalis]|uniref:2-amino-4-hydroxy-6-hydroxymethyldihydropteridine pyrophosphokinase n=1 Tax=Winogradskyella bathintestinalis TaxID=3035208 RepID=A0ABT7ZYQ5_9FLAO|nr:2-amino-4-hydroxy-6-hydroxymethyldihydropteridine diphosphokinase [Winogradskyella bathintestinalis]MDN3494134.1 2-amino-4-hydroxy-6-hydroxymethyldihydropteridine diphosphokinase [Winogradskyella bathintestinalis]